MSLFSNLIKKNFQKSSPCFLFKGSLSDKLPQVPYLWLALLQRKYLIILLYLRLPLSKVLIYASYVVVGSFLKQFFVCNVFKETKQVCLVNTAVAIHIVNSERKFSCQSNYINIELSLAHYLFLELFVKQFVVYGHAEIEKTNDF